jgi:hypothetical protein
MGIYASEEPAVAAFARMVKVGVGGLYVVTVLHPRRCTCPEVEDE